jgi:hypothetical protein
VGLSYVASVAKTLVESWNGSAWSVVASPNSGTGGFLSGVSCTSSSRCIAVGYSISTTANDSLVESWNGTAWSIVASPNAGTTYSQFIGGFCSSASNCFAVGADDNRSGVAQTMIQQWNGTAWSLSFSPNQAGGENSLSAVSCTGSTNCMAVGAYFNGVAQQTLVER